MRHWRHPSEVGGTTAVPAIAGGAQRGVGVGPSVTFGVLAFGGTAAALLFLGFAGFTFDAGSAVSVDNAPPGDQVAVSAFDDAAAELAPAEQPANSAPVAGGEGRTTLSLATPPSTTGDVESFTRPVQSEGQAGKTPAGEELVQALLATGVFSGQGSGDRLASFLVHDGLVLSSASALDGRSSVWLALDGQWVQAPVRGVDLYTDVAVLQPVDWFDELTAAAVQPADAQADAKVQVDPLTGQMSGQARPTSWSGVVAQLGQMTVTAAGHHWYEALGLSIPVDETLPGSVVLNETGLAIGIVINSQAPLASAIPLDLAINVARSLTINGLASQAWIGIEVATDNDGETRLISVDPASPAVDRLRPGDVVVSMDGDPVHNADHIVFNVRQAGPGADLDLVVRRDGRYHSVTITAASAAR